MLPTLKLWQWGALALVVLYAYHRGWHGGVSAATLPRASVGAGTLRGRST